ncbi:MAG: Gfo/Idh/MocA family oxidoreductase [Minicystis sp.]
MDRRAFLINAAAAGAHAALGGCRTSASVQPLALGFIGLGDRGKQLIRRFLRVPGVRAAAVCDIYDPRFDEVKELLGAAVPSFRDHRALLDRRDVDAVVVATPPSLHREHVIAALESGRPVYGEKSLGFSIEDCDAVRAAVARTHQIFQIGFQYRYASWFAEAIDRARSGELGTVTHVDGYWHRNTSWRTPVPRGPDQEPDPALERLLNWRLHRATSGGLLMELGAHQIDVANRVFGDLPESAIGEGGLDHYKDGRDVNDNVKAIFRYPGGRTFSFSALTTSAEKGFQIWIHGTEGSARLTLRDAMFFRERPAKRCPPGPGSVDAVTGATCRAGADPSDEDSPIDEPAAILRMRPGVDDATAAACRAFCDAVRTGARPSADERVGWGAAVAAILGNRAIDQGRRIRFADPLAPG